MVMYVVGCELCVCWVEDLFYFVVVNGYVEGLMVEVLMEILGCMDCCLVWVELFWVCVLIEL